MLLLGLTLSGWPAAHAQSQASGDLVQPVPTGQTSSMASWVGLKVSQIEFSGVTRERLNPLPQQLPQQPGVALDATNLSNSLRELFATGLYRNIAVEGVRHGQEVTLIFTGAPTQFLGHLTLKGIKNVGLSGRLEYAPGLVSGNAIQASDLTTATENLRQALEQNGYYQSEIAAFTSEDAENSILNVQYLIELGKKARIGKVAVEGNSGMSANRFQRKGKLKTNSKVTRDTVSRALTRIGKYYQKKDRLEAQVKLNSKHYEQPINRLNYNFEANQNAVVRILVEGVKLGKSKIRQLVPIYQEGDIDQDLLNEGSKNIHDYYQREGYFDVQVSYSRSATPDLTQIIYKVTLGLRSQVMEVNVSGNQYFTSNLLKPRLVVKAKSFTDRHGVYSQDLTDIDANTIKALYQMNGFTEVSVTPEVKVDYKVTHRKKIGLLYVNYRVVQGKQHTFGTITIAGNHDVATDRLKPLLASYPHQPYNPEAVINDRNALLTYYLAHGFDQARVQVEQLTDASHPDQMNVKLTIEEGEQTFIRKVLLSGLHYTKYSTVEPMIQIKPGEPLNRTALRESERNLYNLTLFNEVHTAVENPNGQAPEKNVLIHFTEAKRWNVTYGFGMQAQTGTPSSNCPSPATLIQLGLDPSKYKDSNCSPNGKFGVSPVVVFDVSRINLLGTDQSISLKTKYGSLEQLVELAYNHPYLFHKPGLSYSFGGGYSNAQDITTYTASRLQANARLTQKINRMNTLIYQFSFRRVKVDANSVQVAPNLIPLLSEPVRVGGPALTWLYDTRRPQPLNATHGWYNNMQEFVSSSVLASQANFNRFQWNNSNYITFGTRKFTIARNTEFGFERAYGEPQFEEIPLPERLYAGGAQSLRGFGMNDAGPRDALTGFPIGGAGLFINQTELRLPPPTLPYVGNSLSFVLFHDMGNIFNNSSDIWPSMFRVRQPHSATCRDLNIADQEKKTRNSSTNPNGTCSFNDFSHAAGVGLRYHTPIGPLRVDFSYNLNPPIYPVIYTYDSCTSASGVSTNICPSVKQAPHFNVFFSIGQAF